MRILVTGATGALVRHLVPAGYRPLLPPSLRDDRFRGRRGGRRAGRVPRPDRARQAGTTITDPKAYLTTVLSRLGINYLRSARVRREAYVGDWLPEPVVVPAGGSPKIPPAWHLRVTPARGAGS